MAIDYSACAQWLRERDEFLILTHVRPDGDTVGSAGALCAALRSLGKTAYLFDNPQFTDKYGVYTKEFLAPKDFAASYNIAVDTASRDMCAQGFEGEVALCIDHHMSNSFYAGETLLKDLASCGEVIFELLLELGVNVTPQMAELLYVAISTDTGCFCYGNTRAETLAAASELARLGADIAALNKLLFRTSSVARIALEGMIFSGIKMYGEGRIATALITLDMLERANAVEDDCEDLANLPGRIEGVLASVTLRETAPNEQKISLRSSSAVNASDVCARFGGGGHAAAAGCTINATPEQALEKIVAALMETLP